MGQDNRKPLIIEFNGIPGAGKSTTAITVKQLLIAKGIKVMSSKKITGYKKNYKEVILSKEIRNIYITFLKAFFLISPISFERLKYMNVTFNHWLGIKKFTTSKNEKGRVCILEQGIIQGFVSMAYQGRLRSEEKYYKYIRQIVSGLDNVVIVNCDIDTCIAKMRMRTRKMKWGRLDWIKSDKELSDILILQKSQFEKIREHSIANAFEINTSDQLKRNAEQIVQYCMEYLRISS